MNIAYKLFHLPRDYDRNKLVENVHSNLLKNIKILDTDTIKISSYDEYVSFKNQNLDFNIDLNGYNLDNRQGWRYGEVGIWASNWLAWKNFIDSDYDYLILMEDDIVLYENFLIELEKYMKQLPKGFDAFHAFCPADQNHKYNASLDVSDKLCSSYQDWSAACYLITREWAKFLIDKYFVDNKYVLPNNHTALADFIIYNGAKCYSKPLFTYSVDFETSITAPNNTKEDKENPNGIHYKSRKDVISYWEQYDIS
jgi:GR25 family glycosyltransferase involved in LPS biosynthesis